LIEQQSEHAFMAALHEAINNLIEQRLRRALETGETVNVPDLAAEMTESLADLVVCGAPPEEQPRLIAYIVGQLGRFVTDKRKAGMAAQLQ
jgi:cytochrome P450